MRIHHLRAGTLCPMSRRLLAGTGGWFETGELVCHCLLVELPDGLLLVDTGFGTEDVRLGPKRYGWQLHLSTRPVRAFEETALARIQALGFDPADVRHIVLTHLDPDHAGGLADFPNARVHVMHDEKAAADAPATRIERSRYHADIWSHVSDWATYAADGETWKGFPCVKGLRDLPPEVLLVPLPGHTRGHAAVAIDAGSHWLLHCGDAYFFEGEMNPDPFCPAGLRFFQRQVAVDDALRIANQERLRELRATESESVRLFCAHDPRELASFDEASSSTREAPATR